MSNEEADLPFLDAHHHFWDLDRLYYPSLTDRPHEAFFGHSSLLGGRNYLPEDYHRDAAGHHVIGTVHVEAECDRDQAVAETRWLTELNEACGLPSAIVGYAPFDSGDTEEILAAHVRCPLFRGIRCKPRTTSGPDQPVDDRRGTMRDPRWQAGLSLLEKHDLSWDLRVPWWHLEEAAEVLRDFPGVRVILNHTGLPWDRSAEGLARWRRGMEALAACENVDLKLSELGHKDLVWTYESNAPIVREAIRIFGVDRCMFASNFPVSGLRVSYDHMLTSFKRMVSDLPRADQEKLFAGNAMRAYRIQPEGLLAR